MPSDLNTRIKAIQKQIKTTQTGIIDLPTCTKIEERLGITVKGIVLTTHVRAIQQALKIVADGIMGPVTISRIEAYINPTLPNIPTGASMVITYSSLDTLIRAEITSEKYIIKNTNHRHGLEAIVVSP